MWNGSSKIHSLMQAGQDPKVGYDPTSGRSHQGYCYQGSLMDLERLLWPPSIISNLPLSPTHPGHFPLPFKTESFLLPYRSLPTPPIGVEGQWEKNDIAAAHPGQPPLGGSVGANLPLLKHTVREVSQHASPHPPTAGIAWAACHLCECRWTAFSCHCGCKCSITLAIVPPGGEKKRWKLKEQLPTSPCQGIRWTGWYMQVRTMLQIKADRQSQVWKVGGGIWNRLWGPQIHTKVPVQQTTDVLGQSYTDTTG